MRGVYFFFIIKLKIQVELKVNDNFTMDMTGFVLNREKYIYEKKKKKNNCKSYWCPCKNRMPI